MPEPDDSGSGWEEPRENGRWRYALLGAGISLAFCIGLYFWMRWNDRTNAQLNAPIARPVNPTRAPVTAEVKQDYCGVVFHGTMVDLASQVEGRLQTVG